MKCYHYFMQTYEDSKGNLVLVLPRMLGSRAKAVSLMAYIPDFLEGVTVEVIATYSPGAHHAFVDEFCTQILNYRKARKMTFVNVPDMMKESIEFYAIVRDYSDKVSFELRKEE